MKDTGMKTDASCLISESFFSYNPYPADKNLNIKRLCFIVNLSRIDCSKYE